MAPFSRIVDEPELPLRRDGLCNGGVVLRGVSQAHHVVRRLSVDTAELIPERPHVIDDIVRSKLPYPLRCLRARCRGNDLETGQAPR